MPLMPRESTTVDVAKMHPPWEDLSDKEAGDWSLSSSSCLSDGSYDSSSNSGNSESSSSSAESSISCFSVMGDLDTLEDELSQLLSRASSGNSTSVCAGPSLAASFTADTPVYGITNPGSHRVPSRVIFDAPIDVQDEDVLANIKKDLLRMGNMFATQGTAFRERATTLASINYLSANVPSSVLDHLGIEVRHSSTERNVAKSNLAPIFEMTECETEGPGRSSFYSADSSDAGISSLPYVAPSLGAVLFCKILPAVDEFCFSPSPLTVDITGFTAMSALHGPETVTKLTNKYFELIAKSIFDFDGDIQKYAGDALFAEWRKNPTRSLEECVYLATLCACKLAQDLSHFPLTVQVGTERLTIEMNHHSGLGCGDTIGIHIGDNTRQREYLHVGDSIEQATKACTLALSSEVVVSPQFGEILQNHIKRERSTAVSLIDYGFGKLLAKLASNGETQNTFRRFMKKPEEIALSRAITRHVEGLDLDSLKEYRRLIALYCHPVVKAGDLAAKRSASGEPDNFVVEPELRNVCVAFLDSGLVLHKASKAGAIDHDVISKINRVRNIISKELINFPGHSQSFIDEKGFSILLTFGLRGCTFPELVPQLALPAAMLIRNVLEKEENVVSTVGATYGKVYCGFVGGEHRHEYTVLGPTANLASRLMASPCNKGLLTDESVYMQSHRFFRFSPVASIVAKGFSNPIMTYLPAERLPQSEQRKESLFVGRRQELSTVLLKANHMLECRCQAEFILVTGPRGGGKSSLLAQLSATLLEASENKMLDGMWSVSSHLSSALTPFASSLSLVGKMLQTSKKEIILAGSSRAEISVLSKSGVWACVNEDLFVRAEAMSEFSSAELNLLGMVLTRIIRNFAETVELLLITIDDCHWLDRFSWEVFRNLLLASGTPTILLVATSMSSDADSFRMDSRTKETMWCQLKKQGRLSVIEIAELENGEVEDMVGRLMDTSYVSEDLLNDVVVESGGVPLYVRQALQGVTGANESFCAHRTPGWSRIHNEILLHQLDELPCSERRCLNIVACLGTTFLGSDVSLICESLYDADEGITARSTLERLVGRGLLRVVTESDDSCFEFRRQRWKNAIRELVPDSKKRYLGRSEKFMTRKKSKPSPAELPYQHSLGMFDGVNPAIVIG